MKTKTKLTEEGKPFSGAIKKREDDAWEYFDTYVDGQYSCESMKAKRPGWWNRPFAEILRDEMGLRLSDEGIKQLTSYEGDLEGLYRVAGVCWVWDNHDQAVTYLMSYPKLRVIELVMFLTHMKNHEISGAQLKAALTDYAVHRNLSKVDISKSDDSFLVPIINSVVNEHSVKIASSDPSKIVNFLVGQVMKQCKGQKVDVASLKAKIESAVTKS